LAHAGVATPPYHVGNHGRDGKIVDWLDEITASIYLQDLLNKLGAFGGVECFADFCCVSFPPLRFFRSRCFMSTGAEAKALVAAGTASGWAVTGASGLGWSAIGVSGAAAADLA
jgi:hypothetical protein